MPAKSKVLHDLYRPQTWKDVVGQEHVLKALIPMIKRGGAQTLLFSSTIPGVGKTTLAYLAAKEWGCTPDTIMDHDAATFTGIDAMRDLNNAANFIPLGQSSKRAVIIDEAHRLSGQAWDSLLKATEKPPEHLMWIFCTTNIGKVPATIKSRCAKFELKPVDEKELGLLFDDVCEAQKIDIASDDSIGTLIIRSAQGSPRQMLVNLETCMEAKNAKEAALLLQTAVETDATLELARMLANKQASSSWMKIMAIVGKFDKNENWEGVRIMISNYMGAALKNAKSDNEAIFFLTRIEAFATPYNPAEGITPLLRSIGQCIFS